MNETILQIISADGWDVIWTHEAMGFLAVPLIGWALVEGLAGYGGVTPRKVVGIAATGDDGLPSPVDEGDEYFLGYRRTADPDPGKWEARADEARRFHSSPFSTAKARATNER